MNTKLARERALIEAQRRWGSSFGAVRLTNYFDHLQGARVKIFEVGEWGPGSAHSRRPQFEVRGSSYISWDDAFANADTKAAGR